MKKLCILLLLALLCACAAPEVRQEPSLPPTVQAGSEYPVFPMEYGGLGDFLFLAESGSPAEVTLRQEYEGELLESQLSFDGSLYTITRDGLSETYPYLIHGVYSLPNRPHISHTFLLSDDETMTIERFWNHMLSSQFQPDFPRTTQIYSYGLEVERTTEIGSCPYSQEQLLTMASAQFCENSFFVENEDGSVSRYDFGFRLLSTTRELPTPHGDYYEYEDGFLCVGDALSRCDGAGRLLWQYDFSQETAFACLAVVDGDIYTARTIWEENSPSFVELTRFSPEGEVLAQRSLEGNDFDAAYRLDGQLRLYGTTQSTRGDIALSKDGYGVYYLAQLDDRLQVLSVVELEDVAYGNMVGWHQGEPVWPEDAGDAYALFDLDDAQVKISSHNLAEYPFTPMFFSSIHYYTETVVTSYAPDGSILWRAVTPVQYA